MAKSKTTEKDFLPQFDHLPVQMRAREFVEGRLNLLAGFYGFEKIALSLFEEARVFSPLQK